MADRNDPRVNLFYNEEIRQLSELVRDLDVRLDNASQRYVDIVLPIIPFGINPFMYSLLAYVLLPLILHYRTCMGHTLCVTFVNVVR